MGKSCQMRSADEAELVLDEMQKLDEKIAPSRRLAQELSNVFKGKGIDLPTLGCGPRPPSPLFAPGTRRFNIFCLCHPKTNTNQLNPILCRLIV
jgi:hypothetical protein